MNLKNNSIFAWRVDRGLEQFLINLCVFRLMDYSHRRFTWRAIFSGQFLDYRGEVNAGEFINDWPVDCAIELRYLECGIPSDPANGKKVVLLEHCIPIQRWIPHLIVGNPHDAGIVTAYIDVECRPTWYFQKLPDIV